MTRGIAATDIRSVVLAGNPNSGKTTLFNALTGSDQHVGNWPGKTVERREGRGAHRGRAFTVTDLPGTYSLSATSPEESIARDVLLSGEPDVVVVVIDASRLERNLYLAAQVLEVGVPTVLCLNMSDVARAQGSSVDVDLLRTETGTAVVTTVARTGEGIGDLLDAIAAALERTDARPPFLVDYGPAIEAAVDAVAPVIRAMPGPASLPVRWTALSLLEDGEDLRRHLAVMPGGPEVVAAADAARADAETVLRDPLPLAVAAARYDRVHDLAGAAETDRPVGQTRSDRVDRIVLHPVAGLLLFLFAMWAVFKLTADVATVFLDWIDATINGPVARWVAGAVTATGAGGGWFEDLMVSGIVAGVGGVLVFLPVLITLYLALGILEDSGYMARGALVMERLMRRLGLPAKSVLPMLVGFGCTVPAVYATRTLERRRDRVLTGLLVPFMSCGARLPVYVLMAAAFFPRHRGTVVFAMYMLGVLVALAIGALLSRTVLRADDRVPLVLELPAYRRPTWRAVWSQTWRRTRAFIRDAGTLILATSVVVWLLLAIPVAGDDRFGSPAIDDSLFGVGADAVSPVFAPAGFGSAEATGALATGFVAKEVVVSSIAQLYGAVDDSPVDGTAVRDDLVEVVTSFAGALRDAARSIPGIVGIDLATDGEGPAERGLLASVRAAFDASSGGHGAAAALAFCVFVLLYTPCVATVAALRRELGTRWMWTSVVGQTALAWTMAVVVFQAGRLIGGVV